MVLLLIAAGCSNNDDNAGSSGATGGGASGQSENTGTVNVLSAMEPSEAGPIQAIFDDKINSQTDYKAEIEADGDFEAALPDPGRGRHARRGLRAAAGRGGRAGQVAGTIVSLEDMGFNIDELNATFGEYFMSLGEYNGKHYGMPTNINLKSMVWYPKEDVRRGRATRCRRRGTS